MRVAVRRDSTVWFEIGNVEIVARVERVRYKFGRQGQAGTVGRLLSDSKAIPRVSDGVLWLSATICGS